MELEIFIVGWKLPCEHGGKWRTLRPSVDKDKAVVSSVGTVPFVKNDSHMNSATYCILKQYNDVFDNSDCFVMSSDPVADDQQFTTRSPQEFSDYLAG